LTGNGLGVARETDRLHRRRQRAPTKSTSAASPSTALKDSDTVGHLVELVDKKAPEIEAAKRNEAELAAAQ
jgi:(E)-4-hydroxy-3-methylbut-2-enyl-diphosphate synthase